MLDVTSLDGARLPIAEITQHITDTCGRNACVALMDNLRDRPRIRASPGYQIIYFASSVRIGDQPLPIWQFRVPNELAASGWAAISHQFRCTKMLEERAGFITPHAGGGGAGFT